MVGSYDYRLVLLSIFIALISSLAAFVFVGRVSRNKAMIAKAWLVLGAISMGSGIWAMHFINMLAFSLPTPTGYGLDDTVLSWLIAVSISWLGLDIASRPGLKVQRLMAAGVIMGLGVAAMHYTGMHAMQMFPAITYDKPLLLLSILVSIVAAVIALFMLFKTSNQPGQNTLRNRLIAACVMAAGICGTHYLGMAAAEFHPYAVCATVSALPASLFAIIIALGSSALILFASILAIMDTQQDDPASRLLADTQERLTRMNMLDVITQLPNRQYFLRHLGIGIRRTTRLGNALAVAVIKLDNLKGLASSWVSLCVKKFCARRVSACNRPYVAVTWRLIRIMTSFWCCLRTSRMSRTLCP
nr:MHYT domain-containing protein [Methylobacillus glycogenes]